jgi:hypothetical protein
MFAPPTFIYTPGPGLSNPKWVNDSKYQIANITQKDSTKWQKT